ncbi:MAG: ribosome assembly RNA-binding protein YhbY [Eggerthia catenaformis]|uniref:ribosome assembly RNA-binding protein YhbY n=1 Tax=Eggerthia catenaformis TaxID=31973 RepID=UPI000A380FA2|nr:RNA-binding protein [Eggerthia catenaformis]
MLTNKQKKYLRSEAHSLNPIFQIGKDGTSIKQINSINDALKVKELIKVKLLGTCPQSINEVSIDICSKTRAEVVHIIGHTIILYKQSEKRIYKLP